MNKKSILKKQQKPKESLHKGLRAIVYSFLPLNDLIQKISKLSK